MKKNLLEILLAGAVLALPILSIKTKADPVTNLDLTMTNNATLTWNWIDQYRLNVNANQGGNMSTRVLDLLGAEAESLLNHECKGIPKAMLHLPGPDFVDRVVAQTETARSRIFYRSKTQTVDFRRK